MYRASFSEKGLFIFHVSARTSGIEGGLYEVEYELYYVCFAPERHSVSVLLSEEKVCAEQSREHSLSLRYRYTCSSRTSNIIRIEAHYSQPTSLQITQLRITGWKLP